MVLLCLGCCSCRCCHTIEWLPQLAWVLWGVGWGIAGGGGGQHLGPLHRAAAMGNGMNALLLWWATWLLATTSSVEGCKALFGMHPILPWQWGGILKHAAIAMLKPFVLGWQVSTC